MNDGPKLAYDEKDEAGANKKGQLIKFKERAVSLLSEEVWSKNSFSKEIKGAFNSRVGQINAYFNEGGVHADKTDEIKLSLEFNLVCLLLIDILSYLEIYIAKGQYSIGDSTTNTGFSEAAKAGLLGSSSKYEYKISELHKQVIEAYKSGGTKPPSEEILEYKDYVAGQVTITQRVGDT